MLWRSDASLMNIPGSTVAGVVKERADFVDKFDTMAEFSRKLEGKG